MQTIQKGHAEAIKFNGGHRGGIADKAEDRSRRGRGNERRGEERTNQRFGKYKDRQLPDKTHTRKSPWWP